MKKDRMMTVVAPRVQSYFKEFPFLPCIVDQKCVVSVDVERVDTNLLQRCAVKVLSYLLFYSYLDGDKIFFIDRAGVVIRQVGVVFLCIPKYIFFGPRIQTIKKVYKTETVVEALASLGDRASSVSTIVTMHQVPDEHSEMWVYRVTVHKSPKGFSIPEWLEEETKKETAALQKLVAGIDEVGKKVSKDAKLL